MTDAAKVPTIALSARTCLIARRHWPDGARVALVVFLYFETGDRPPKPVLTSATIKRSGLFPNYKTYSQYEYGNRVGIVRVLDLFDRHRLPVTVAANSGACEEYPYLARQFHARDYEFAGHGKFATRMLSSRMTEDEERAAIAESLDTIERATGTRPRGWVGQDYGESTVTPRLLAEAGLRYVADWGNDVGLTISTDHHCSIEPGQMGRRANDLAPPRARDLARHRSGSVHPTARHGGIPEPSSACTSIPAARRAAASPYWKMSSRNCRHVCRLARHGRGNRGTPFASSRSGTEPL